MVMGFWRIHHYLRIICNLHLAESNLLKKTLQKIFQKSISLRMCPSSLRMAKFLLQQRIPCLSLGQEHYQPCLHLQIKASKKLPGKIRFKQNLILKRSLKTIQNPWFKWYSSRVSWPKSHTTLTLVQAKGLSLCLDLESLTTSWPQMTWMSV